MKRGLEYERVNEGGVEGGEEHGGAGGWPTRRIMCLSLAKSMLPDPSVSNSPKTCPPHRFPRPPVPEDVGEAMDKQSLSSSFCNYFSGRGVEFNVWKWRKQAGVFWPTTLSMSAFKSRVAILMATTCRYMA